MTITAAKPIHRLDVSELRAAYRARALSPVEVTRHYLERIERLNPTLNAYYTVTGESAMRQARAAERAFARDAADSPLLGIPIGLKDLFDTRGVRTTYGTGWRRDAVPTRDADVVHNLKAAGAVVLGKQALLEFAMGGVDVNAHYGVTPNPWTLRHFAGGSSTGSGVATAADLGVISIGTDTGGSVRQPASYCGVSGLKPSNGLTSLRGVFPVSPTCDTVGPLARSALDVAHGLDGLTGGAHGFAKAVLDDDATLRGLRVGIPRSWMAAHAHPEVATAVEEAVALMAAHGAVVRETPMAYTEGVLDAYRDIVFYEAARAHRKFWPRHRDDYGPHVRARIDDGMRLTAGANAVAVEAVKRMLQQATDAMRDLDVIALPMQPTTAPELGQREVKIGDELFTTVAIRGRFANVINLIGWPGLSVPAGFGADGLPIGMQIVAPWGGDALVLRAGHAYQRITDWHLRRPPIADQ